MGQERELTTAPATAGLNPRQQLFVLHYLETWSATEAAKRAGYSARTAHVQGFELLRHPKIKVMIAAEQQAAMDRLRLDRDAVLRQLARIGFGDVRRLFNADGSLKGVHELDDDAAAMVASVEAQTVTKVRKTKKGEKAPARPQADKTLTVKYRRIDPTRALQLLGQHHGILKEQPAQNTFVQFIIQE